MSLTPADARAIRSTSQPYEYLVLGDDRFQLCATFQQRSNDRAGSGITTPAGTVSS